MNLDNNKKCTDIIIIGGGIIGLFSAYYLASEGKSVRIIEKGEFGSGASHANCGLLFFSELLPLCVPGVVYSEFMRMLKGVSPLSIKPGIDISMWKFLYKFWRFCNKNHMAHAMKARNDILCLSEELFDDFFRQGNPCEWERNGVLIVCKEKDGLSKYNKTNELLKSFGLEGKMLSKQETLYREPALKENIAGGCYHAVDSHLRPDSLISFLKEYLETQGVIFENNCYVKNLSVMNDRISGIDTSRGGFSADRFVIATGAWSGLLLKSMGISIPVEPGKGYSITMQKPRLCPKLPCYMYESNVVATPFKTGYRLGGTMEFSGFNLDLNRKRLNMIRKSAKNYMKEPVGEPVIEEWTSLRPMCADDIPIISRLSGIQNAVLATGHGMMGISMATGTGKLVSEMICERTTAINIDQFSMERFNN